MEILRFTRVVFGLAPSPFLLNRVIQQHLELWRPHLPESIREALKSLYIDDFISGDPTVTDAKKLKRETAEVFVDARFELHKWHSNVPDLETTSSDDEPTFAKQQLENKLNRGKSKLLGIPWDKVQDTLRVVFPAETAELTKRGVLANLAKDYDPLGLVLPVMLEGKLIYREICNQKLAWDALLPDVWTNQWKNWEHKLPNRVTLPHSLATYQERIKEMKLHAFGDASGHGVSAAIYAVTQESGITQGLVDAKSRLAKQRLTIPHLKLISGHMAVNLVTNIHKALEGFPLTTDIQCWLDSTVALHWLRDQGEYRQFVTNRVQKIQSHPNTQWRHVPSTKNPADLGSRGGSVTDVQLWWRGPERFADLTSWPEDIVTQASQQSDAERKVQREIFAAAIKISDDLDRVLEKFDLHKDLRVCKWASRFIHNCQHPLEKIQGPLSTQEITSSRLFWIKRAQQQVISDDHFQEDKLQLNLRRNANGVLKCWGRIQGEYPIFLPDSALYTIKVVQCAHVTTLHGGVGLTMAMVREVQWVPRLRKLTKRVLRNCWDCKRFQAVADPRPPAGPLPRD